MRHGCLRRPRAAFSVSYAGMPMMHAAATSAASFARGMIRHPPLP